MSSVRSYRSVVSSPSDELKMTKDRHEQDPTMQQIEEGYHSVPESGDASNIGYTNAANAKDENPHIQNKNSVGSFMTALESEVPSPQKAPQYQQEPFEDDHGSVGDLSTKFMQMASDASAYAFDNLLSGKTPASKRKTYVQACYLGIAAIFGTLLRLVLAQLFGQACSNPESVGWIKDESVLCVTRDGTATQNEGIIFADLPANVLGSFIMGLLQDGAALGLAVNIPIAFLRPSNIFQSFDIWHTALKTGFCGSLTTFSAWNSEMVVMMVGDFESETNRLSMIWRALFGYVIGIETAIGSYVFGRTVAWWLHQYMNPELAKEQKALNIRETKHGIAINRELPHVERRYLHGISEPSPGNDTDYFSMPLSPKVTLTDDELAPLRRWRESTKEARRVENGISNSLIEIETALISRGEVLSYELRQTAVNNGWDIDGLMEWLTKRRGPLEPPSLSPSLSLTAAGVSETLNEEESVWYTPIAATLLLSIFLMVLVLMMLYLDARTPSEITYRTMAYSMLFAPPGALLRWKLSALNGKLGELLPRFARSAWLPIGTLAANVLGALISICMVGWEFNLEMAGVGGFWGIATVRAIKIGFSGCLSTVSTFVSEVHKLSAIRIDRGYKYILVTLVISAITGMIFFVIIV